MIISQFMKLALILRADCFPVYDIGRNNAVVVVVVVLLLLLLLLLLTVHQLDQFMKLAVDSGVFIISNRKISN